MTLKQAKRLIREAGKAGDLKRICEILENAKSVSERNRLIEKALYGAIEGSIDNECNYSRYIDIVRWALDRGYETLELEMSAITMGSYPIIRYMNENNVGSEPLYSTVVFDRCCTNMSERLIRYLVECGADRYKAFLRAAREGYVELMEDLSKDSQRSGVSGIDYDQALYEYLCENYELSNNYINVIIFFTTRGAKLDKNDARLRNADVVIIQKVSNFIC